MKSLGKIIRSVQAFSRELSGKAPLSEEPKRIPIIGLALGGGFARGIAHVGVLKVLDEMHVPIDAVAGAATPNFDMLDARSGYREGVRTRQGDREVFAQADARASEADARAGAAGPNNN